MFDIMKMVVKIKKRNLFLFSSLFFISSGFVIYFLEPENFETPFIGLWWVMTTVTTVGYGDYVPTTTFGKLFGLFLYIVGITLIGVVIGKIVDTFNQYQRMKEEGRLNFKGKGHFIIVGWSPKSKRTIKELLVSGKENQIVLIDKLYRTPFVHERVTFVQGDPTSVRTLEKANILEANSVCIFAPDPINDVNQADGKTLLIASAIESYSNEKEADIYTIVEIIREKHITNFKHANVDEFVLSNEAFSDLMAKCAVHKGSTELFMQLLSRNYGDDIWQVKTKREWETYGDAFEGLKELGAILVSNGRDFSIVRKLKEKIPNNAKLYVICDKDTYKKITVEA